MEKNRLSLKQAFKSVKRKLGIRENKKVAKLGLDYPIKRLIGHPEEIEKLVSILAKVSESPFGKNLIKALDGYTIAFEDGIGNRGSHFKSDNRIVLNSDMNEQEALTTFCHEARHAEQYKNFPQIENVSHYNTKSQLITQRAMEADAETAAVRVAFDLKDKYPEIYEIEKQKKGNCVFSFENEITKTGDLNKALTAAFRGWYVDYHYRENYDLTFFESIERSYFFSQRKLFKEELPLKEFVSNLCKDENGKSYFTKDPSILENEHMLSLPEKLKSRIDHFFKKRPQGYDDSVKKIPTYKYFANSKIAERAAVGEEMSGIREVAVLYGRAGIITGR